jgi:hypothetical protein
MPDLFKEILPSILKTKINVFESDDYKDYNAFIVNRALSYHMDCLPYAAEMGSLPHLDKDMQYQYLINTIRSYKRPFHKWEKVEAVEDLNCVKTYFGYSDKKAKDVLSILSKNQLDEIKKKTDKGGVKK